MEEVLIMYDRFWDNYYCEDGLDIIDLERAVATILKMGNIPVFVEVDSKLKVKM